jgi:hypothetical protein
VSCKKFYKHNSNKTVQAITMPNKHTSRFERRRLRQRTLEKHSKRHFHHFGFCVDRPNWKTRDATIGRSRSIYDRGRYQSSFAHAGPLTGVNRVAIAQNTYYWLDWTRNVPFQNRSNAHWTSCFGGWIIKRKLNESEQSVRVEMFRNSNLEFRKGDNTRLNMTYSVKGGTGYTWD